MNIIQDFIPAGRRNRPGTKMTPKYITVHDTGNPTAGAEQHGKYLKGDSAANAPVSWHYTVDDKVIVQHLPLDEIGFHAGDGKGPGNMSSIGVEICEFTDPAKRAKAEDNAAELIAWLVSETKAKEKQHFDFSGKNCPRVIRSRPNGWAEFLKKVESFMGTAILGNAQATEEQAKEWAKQRKATDEFISLAALYWKIAPSLNVRPEVAYAQSAKETGFGRFGGVINATYHNPCGLKTTSGGSNSDPNAHQRFPDWPTGILAHVQHLALYAGVTVKENIVDPRHFDFIRGRAKTVEELGGNWAPSKEYGKSILESYLIPLMKTVVPKLDTSWKDDVMNRLYSEGLLNSPHNPDDRPTWAELAAVIVKVLDRA